MSRHVLVADDNDVNRRLFIEMLKILDCTVDVVVNGSEAVDAVENRDYDLVLMDWRMPEMDGLEAVGVIRRQEAEHGRPRTPVVAVSGNVFESDKQACTSAGMDGFLSKPFRLEELRDTLERHAGKCSTESDAEDSTDSLDTTRA